MSWRLTTGTVLAGAIFVAGISASPARPGDGGTTHCFENAGPDVIVGAIDDTAANYVSSGGYDAFAIGTNACNIGTEEAIWEAISNQHPVIAQSMFRLKDGRFEQIGQSWLKHGFFANQDDLCCPCTSAPDGDRLGVGCSDLYTAPRNGAQYNLGPKYEVNPHTGAFPFPPASPPYCGNVARRLRVATRDLDPARDGGGLYFVEAHYVSPDDAAAGNQNNNASHRQVSVSGGALDDWEIGFDAMPPTRRERPAIRAWREHDPGVVETIIQVPDDGQVILAARATDLGDGWHRYEYAVQNLNCARAVGSFAVPLPPGAIARTVGFHDVAYHGGEPFAGTDWPGILGAGAVTWSTTPHDEDPGANALRWGTLYNFRFESTAPPGTVEVALGLFAPGTPGSPDMVTATTVGPGPGLLDCNENGIDDLVDVAGGGSADCNGNGAPDECEADCDGNGVPDACEPDGEGDGVADVCDNCPLIHNAEQQDHDGDGVGNACDLDYCYGDLLADDFEDDLGWIAENLGATSGDWERGVPVDDPDWPNDPAGDADGSGACFLTGNAIGNTDVDDGAVRLTSPRLALATGGITVAYDYFLRLSNALGADRMLVEISADDGAGPWIEIALHDDDHGLEWTHHEITGAELDAAGVVLTGAMRIRFTVNDDDPQSIVEAGLDGFAVRTDRCLPDCNGNGLLDADDIAAGASEDCDENGVPDECQCAEDVNGDSLIGFADLLLVLSRWGTCAGCPEDIDGDGAVGFSDLLRVLSAWGDCL